MPTTSRRPQSSRRHSAEIFTRARRYQHRVAAKPSPRDGTSWRRSAASSQPKTVALPYHALADKSSRIMFRFIFRFIGLWILAVAFVALIRDGTKTIAASAVVVTKLAKHCY